MKRILVAEDWLSSREFIRAILESAGYEVIEAVNGVEAVEKALETQIDLFLLDLEMPKLDGFGVVERLRGESRFAQAPFVALTACAMLGDRERALGAGFTSYIAKPVDIPALRAELKRLIGH